MLNPTLVRAWRKAGADEAMPPSRVKVPHRLPGEVQVEQHPGKLKPNSKSITRKDIVVATGVTCASLLAGLADAVELRRFLID